MCTVPTVTFAALYARKHRKQIFLRLSRNTRHTKAMLNCLFILSLLRCERKENFTRARPRAQLNRQITIEQKFTDFFASSLLARHPPHWCNNNNFSQFLFFFLLLCNALQSFFLCVRLTVCITRSRLLLLLLLFVFFFVSFFFVFAVFCLILLLYFYFVAIGCRNTHKLIATAATKLRCMLQPFIVLLYILFVFFLFLAMKFFPMHVFYVLLIHSFFRSVLISFFAVPFHFVRFLFRSSCS